jgi:hypothetical protein
MSSTMATMIRPSSAIFGMSRWTDAGTRRPGWTWPRPAG